MKASLSPKFFFKNFSFLFLLLGFLGFSQQPYIDTGSGIGKYGYLEKDASTFMTLNSNTYSNIYQLFGRTWLNSTNILTYGTAVNSCAGSGVVQTTNDYVFGANAIPGQTAYTSVHADYCGGSNSYSGNPNQTGFNERTHIIFDIADRPSDLSATVNPVNGANTVVLSVKIDFGTLSDRVLQRFWIQNTGTMAESTDIANDGFKIFYEPATGSEVFNGTESSATLYGDYNSNSTTNNLYGHDALNITIPSGGLRVYVVLNKFNNTCVGSKTVQVSLINDGMSFTPLMDGSFNLARVGQTPLSPTSITASSSLTGALNGTYSIPSACLPTIASAVSYLNTNGISGPVVFNVAAGHTETAPSGGINLLGSGAAGNLCTGTSTNTITFQKSGSGANPKITAPLWTAGGNTDGIVKIVGGDYITFDGIDLQENSGNTVTATGATNTMTEVGYGLFLATATNGAQNNTIKNCNISLNSTYANSIGIFSTSSSSSTNGVLTASSSAGTNSNNKIYGNTITNVAYGIFSICEPITATINESGWDIGGTSATTGNNITFGSATTSTSVWNRFPTTTGGGIVFRNGAGVNVRYNTVASNTLSYPQTTFGGILISSGTAPTGITYTSTISNNTVTLNQTGTTLITGIDFGHGISTGTIVGSNNNITINQTLGAAATTAVTGIKANYASATNTLDTNTVTINQTTSTGANSGALTGINAAGVGTTVNVTNNTITLKQATTGGTYSGAVTYVNVSATSGTINVTGNTLNTTGSTIRSTGNLIGVNQDSTVTTLVNNSNNTANIDRVATSGTVYYHYTSSTPSEVKDIINNNNISFTNLSGTTAVTVINCLGGPTSPATGNKTINNNTITLNNTNTHTGTTIGITLGYAQGFSVANNSLTLNSASPTVTGISAVTGVTATAVNNINGNSFSIISSTSSPTSITAISATTGGNFQIYSNTISSLTFNATAATGSPQVFAISNSVGTNNIYNNNISGLSIASTSTASPNIRGINLTGGTSTNVYGNTLSNFSTGACSGTASILGISAIGATTPNIYANNINNISTGSSGSVNVFGINMQTTATTYNVYNNLISDLRADSSNSSTGFSILGINCGVGTGATFRVYYNTLKLGTTASPITTTGANFGVIGVGVASGGSLDLRNNIININATPKGANTSSYYAACVNPTGLGTAGTVTTNFASTSNNNIYFINSGANNYLYVEGQPTSTALRNGYALNGLTANTTNNIVNDSAFNTSCSLYKIFASGRDASTFAEDNLVSVSPPATGGFAPTGASFAENGAQAISTPGITTDFNGTTRTASTNNDIGALQFSGTGTDASAPSISYTAISNPANSCASVTLSANITDATGVNTTAGTKPRIWYKKSTNANALPATNDNTTDGWKYVEASNAGSPFTFTLDYNLINGGVSAGDVIQYFVVAQDTAASVNVGTNTATYNTGFCPTSVALASTAFAVSGYNSFTIQNGTATAGTTTASNTSICNSGTTSLNITPASGTLTGYIYDIQSSTSGAGTWTTVASGLTSLPYTTPTISSSTDFQIIVKSCTGSTVFTSSPVTVTVNNPTITGTTNGVRCGDGTVTLAATASGTASVSWYAAATGGSTLGTGNTFVTPSLTASGTPYNYYAQADIIGSGNATIGSGTTTTSTSGITPFTSNWENSRIQYVVPASELIAAGLRAGNITTIAFDVSVVGGTGTNQKNYSIKLGATSSTAFASTPAYLTPTSGFTTVYTNASLPAPTLGINTLSFSTPYNWDGSSNLLVEICHENDATASCSLCYTTNATVKYTTTTYNSVYGQYADNTAACGVSSNTSNSTYTNRPNIIFGGQVLTCSSSPRTLVTATVNIAPALTASANQTICNGEIGTLSATSTLSNFDNYTWSPATGLYTDATATTPYTTGTNASTVYVKNTTAGATTYTLSASNSSTSCTNTATTIVTVLPASVTVNASTSTICQSGTTTLSLSPSTGYGSGTIQWQSSSDNVTYTDISGANSTSYTTGTLTSTTYYQAVIKNGSGVTCITTSPVTVTVNNPSITGTTPGTRCGAGTVTLSATGSTGTTLSWYDALTGGNLLGTGSSYTTPSISSTTNYYVEAGFVGSGNATIGTGASTTTATTQPSAFVNRWASYRIQTIYTAAELTAAGMKAGNITAIAYNITSLGDSATNANFTVKIGTTSLSTFSSTTWESTTGYTTVYPAATYTHTASGLQTIPFSTPYAWDGTSNILIDVTYSGANSINNSITKYTATSGNTVLHSNTSGSAATSGTLSTTRLDLTFTGQVITCTSSPRTQITATVNTAPALSLSTSSATICNGGSSSTISLTSNASDFDTYTWTPASGVSGNATTGWTFNPTGSTNYTLNASNSSTTCTNSATFAVTVIPTATVSASPASICVSGATTVSLSPSTVGSYGSGTIQWQVSTDGSSFTDISGANGTSYTTGTLTATTWYKAIIKDGAGNVCQQPTVTITVNNPTITGTTNGVRCGTGTVTLSATGSTGTTLSWYDALTGGNLLGTGNNYTTASLAPGTYNYYVEANIPTPVSGTVGASYSGSTNNSANVGSHGIRITTTRAITINGAKIPFTGTGTFTIALQTDAGTAVSNVTTASVTGSGTTAVLVPFTLNVPSAGTYRLLITAVTGTVGALGYTTATFPYTESTNSVSVISGYWYGNDSTNNMYLFNLAFSAIGTCSSSPRTLVTATVSTPPALALSSTSATICNGSSTTTPVTISTGSSNYDTYSWSPSTNVSGNSTSGWTFNPTITTTYTLTANDSSTGCSNTATFTVTVNPAPTDIVINATPASATTCSEDYVQLNATGGTINKNLLFETFDSGSLPSGWTIENYSTGGTIANADWKVVASPHSSGTQTLSSNGTPFVISDSDAQGASGTSTDTYINLPSLDTRGYTSLSLNFDQYFRYYQSLDEADIYISTNGGTSWTIVKSFTTTQGSASSFLNTTVDLSAYINQPSVLISLGYYSYYGYSYWWALDNIKVSGNIAAVTWSPATGLYTDAALTIPYVAGNYASTLYAAPDGTQAYTASATTGTCSKSTNVTVNHNKKTFTGATNNNWSVAANWSPVGVPDITRCVYIPSAKVPVVDISTAAANKVTVASGGSLNIPTGNVLTVQNEIVNNNAAATPNFIVQNNANLIQVNDTATNTGNIRVERSTQPNLKRLDYVYWGAPVTGQGLKAFSPNTFSSRFYTYNETTDMFVSVPGIATATFTPGVGYAIRVPDNYLSTPATQQYNGVFVGVPNNGTAVTYPATKNANGFNLISNPYPSNLELDDLNTGNAIDEGFYAINKSVINKKFYFWTNHEINPTALGSSYNGANYAIWNGSGSVAPGNPPIGSNPGNLAPTSAVKVGQGFIAEAHTAGTLVFNNSMRTSATSNFISKNVPQKDRYWLSMVTPANNYYNQLIAYVDGATNNLDPNYDAEKLEAPSDDFYSVLNSKKLTIQGRQYPLLLSDVVPLGSKFATTGSYKITLTKTEGIFANGQNIYLKDNQTGIWTNLSQTDYSFTTATTGISENRFEIHYLPQGTMATQDNVKDGVVVYRDGDDFVVKSTKKITGLELYDASGRLISKAIPNEVTAKVKVGHLVDAIYILKIKQDDEIISKKIRK